MPLTVLDSPYRDITGPVLDYVAGVRRDGPRDLVVVYMPEYVVGHWWEHLLHNQSALRLKARLLFQPGVMVTNVPVAAAVPRRPEARRVPPADMTAVAATRRPGSRTRLTDRLTRSVAGPGTVQSGAVDNTWPPGRGLPASRLPGVRARSGRRLGLAGPRLAGLPALTVALVPVRDSLTLTSVAAALPGAGRGRRGVGGVWPGARRGRWLRSCCSTCSSSRRTTRSRSTSATTSSRCSCTCWSR